VKKRGLGKTPHRQGREAWGNPYKLLKTGLNIFRSNGRENQSRINGKEVVVAPPGLWNTILKGVGGGGPTHLLV